MNLSVTLRQVNGVVVIEVTGRVRFPDRSLEEIAAAMIERGLRRFILDLRRVSYFDNGALTQLCRIYTMLQPEGGQIVLLHLNPNIRRLLAITRLDTVFSTFETLSQALDVMESGVAVSA